MRRFVLWGVLWMLATGMLVTAAPPAEAQVDAVNLSGTVYDPQGATVAGAKITVTSEATGAARSTTSNSSGQYFVVGLPPGHYRITVEAAGFTKLVSNDVSLRLGAAAVYDPHVSLATGKTEVTVSAQPDLIETTKSTISNTVTQTQINDLPINGRNYINFTLLDSQTNRDSAPVIGPAPTSGLNIGGQRARSNEVSVDGADAVDNSVNGVRSTVSQEAVQEFQLITSGYMPEYGRATGGVVNIVTKSGSNQTHGDLFGFLRDSAIQARNPFSVQVNPATGIAEPVKQSFTRVQAGATIGGPIRKDKTFYFFSYELTRREETGFSDIGTGNFGFGAPQTPVCTPGTSYFLTAQQLAFANGLANVNPAACATVAAIYGGAAATAIYGNTKGGPTNFPLPIYGGTIVPLPSSFVGLQSLIGNYPIHEGTSLYSLRLDQIWNATNTSFLRVGISPSLITGIESNSQNQNSGENAGSRTGLQQTRDWNLVFQHTTAIQNNLFNEFRYQFARRGLHFGYSDLPGGSQVGVNIPGIAFFGREPFSTVDRIERRNQWSDDMSWVKGHHTMKFGVDTNLIQVGSNDPIIFQLDFGGEFNFGSVDPTPIFNALGITGLTGVPQLNAVQSYGIGIPQNFIQGIGSQAQPHFDNKTLGVFWQDSWKVTQRLTLNYGVRYDIEFTPTFAAANPLNAAAEQAEGVVEGIPVDPNNIQPRIGLAWDPTGSGKTVVRAGYGIYYDHPLLAIAFDSTTADGTRNSQLILPGGTATGTPLALNPINFNASSIFQGVLNTTGISGISYLPGQQRFDPFNSPFFNNQNYLGASFPLAFLPFTFPVAKNFVYGQAQEASLGIERELSHDWKVSATYNYTHGVHLNRPRDQNSPLNSLLIGNDAAAIAAGLAQPGASPLGVGIPDVAAGTCVPTTSGGVLVTVPGILGEGFTNGSCAGTPIGVIGTAAVFNYFRPSGPNPSFAPLVGGFANLAAIAKSAGYPTGPTSTNPNYAGVPYSSVDQQESSGNSNYNALTVLVQKRVSQKLQLYSSWTWSHAIDDSTDLQSLLEPQNDRFANLERGNSTFDQRHRWITSAVIQSPYRTSDQAWWKKILANSLASPIVELSSGRPYTVLTGTDYNLNFSSNTDRPSIVPAGTAGATTSPYLPNVGFVVANVCNGIPSSPYVPSPPLGCDGNLGRNTFVRPGYFDIDLRVSRTFNVTDRWNVQLIGDAFNLLNRLNYADVNPLCDPGAAATCAAGQPTAALDPRQFQFALKVNW